MKQSKWRALFIILVYYKNILTISHKYNNLNQEIFVEKNYRI